MSTSQRALILDGAKSRINTAYGPAGISAHWFRNVWRRPWAPGNQVRPALTVVDGGQQQLSDPQNEDTKEYELTFQTVLDLEADWSREKSEQDWSDRVEALKVLIQNWLPAYGVLEMNYRNDEPVEVVLQAGKVEAIWVIEFTARYFCEVGVFGKS